MNGKEYDNIPDVRFGEAKPYDQIQLPDPEDDPDPESEEFQAATTQLYKELFDIDLDELINEEDPDNNTRKDNAG